MLHFYILSLFSILVQTINYCFPEKVWLVGTVRSYPLVMENHDLHNYN